MRFDEHYLMESKELTLYHGSNSPIDKFDREFSAQGVFWFSEDKDKILRGESGSVSTKYLITAKVNVNKTAGWDLYDKLSLGEINQMGYDSIKLDDDWVIFDSDNIKVVDVEKIK
jgi:hypothetical protein